MPAKTCVGVGLRYEHYESFLADPLYTGEHSESVCNHKSAYNPEPACNIKSNSQDKLDFVEVHAENFYASGGATRAFLREVATRIPVSLHATALGLGSASVLPHEKFQKLKALVDEINPFLVSDHACFTWGVVNDQAVHGGDLLPLIFNQTNLNALIDNVKRVQEVLGRTVLIENVCAYLFDLPHELEETEFLTQLVEQTQCQLIVDLNNVLVNARNLRIKNPHAYAENFLQQLPPHAVGEIHLAGCTPVSEDAILVDDHGAAVSNHAWEIYALSQKYFPCVPTLIEWDTQLPDWQTLLSEASKARKIQWQAIG